MATASKDVRGTVATREFYDRRGWTRDGDRLVDGKLFGVREDGPIRQEMHRLGNERIRRALGGPGLRLIECGCGGEPATFLADLCAHITAVDFSTTGLVEAGRTLAQIGVPFRTVAADTCRLPFPDGSFDAAYSAHSIYHIDDPAAQEAAFDQVMRVVRPGGVAVFVLANPLPLFFPVRLVRRVLASTPGVGSMLDKLRRKPPLPTGRCRSDGCAGGSRSGVRWTCSGTGSRRRGSISRCPKRPGWGGGSGRASGRWSGITRRRRRASGTT
jgi:SAM-dependent methyltransferase